MRPVRLIFAAMTVFFLAAPLSAANAHPRLLKSSPGAESQSAEVPRQVSLTFNEALDVALTRITLQRGEAKIALDSLRLQPGDKNTIVAKVITTLPPGLYTVRWQVTGDDGHPVKGEFNFTVSALKSSQRASEHRH